MSIKPIDAKATVELYLAKRKRTLVYAQSSKNWFGSLKTLLNYD